MHVNQAAVAERLYPQGAGRTLQFHVLSFEGPDDYSRAGGIATRVNGLTQALTDAGLETHLWFVGDPDRPGHDAQGRLTLHRWCQWISQHHETGVYDGEEGKCRDFAASLPPYLVREVLLPFLRQGRGRAVVLAEEWQTVDAVIHVDWLLRQAGVRDRVSILWNANNEFGFHRINWQLLGHAAQITTVSRYMRCRLWPHGVDPMVVPNGLSDDAYTLPARSALAALRQRLPRRTLLAKVARWDPDKRWLLAVDIVGELKKQGSRPLLVARGGVESHGEEVLAHTAEVGLRVTDVNAPICDETDLVNALTPGDQVDIFNVRSSVTGRAKQLLLRGATAVLANSGREPFGLVGLEAMAVGGLACVGGTGEDYAVSGWNSLVSHSQHGAEVASLLGRVRASPREEQAMRRRGRVTAERYRWRAVIHRDLLSGLPSPGRPASLVAPARLSRARPARLRGSQERVSLAG